MLRAVPNAGTWDGEPHLAAPAAPRSSLRAPAEPFVLSLSSFSPFKALRLHSTQTTSWPRPRFCLSSALSPCQTPTHRVCNSTSVQLRAGLTGGSGDAPNPPPPPAAGPWPCSQRGSQLYITPCQPAQQTLSDTAGLWFHPNKTSL